jgi:signal transduction histidine kinase
MAMGKATERRGAHVRTVRLLDAENRRLRARIAELEGEKAEVEGLVALAAHELVEPLIVTDAYASIVAGRLDAEIHADSRRDLDVLRRGSAHARLLVETLLDHARAGEGPLKRRPVNSSRVVEECLSMLAPEIDFRGARVEVGALPVVAGDETLIRALFVNLLSNALKYGPRHDGVIVVRATVLSGGCRFCVSSQGATIPVEDRERIFDVYRRGRDERRVRGAGLGLAICRRIVERHGGRIWVSAARGGGNRFWFTLPSAPAEP